MWQFFKTIFIQIISIGFLQSMSFVLGVHAFTKNKIIKSTFIICTVIFMIATYLIRLLPIHFGVHTLLSLILLIFLSLYILKFPIYSCVKATLFSTVILLMTEAVNIVFLNIVFDKQRFLEFMEDPILKSIAGIPGNILFFVVIVILYKYLTKEKSNEKAQ